MHSLQYTKAVLGQLKNLERKNPNMVVRLARVINNLREEPMSLTTNQVLGLAEAMKNRTAKPSELAKELGITIPTRYNYVSESGELRSSGLKVMKGKRGRSKKIAPERSRP